MDFDNFYNQTKSHIESLEKRFLESHLNNVLANPDDYDFDVKSFCILCHAAFEDFIETISLKVMNLTIENYITDQKVTKTLVTLLHFKSSDNNYLEDIKSMDNLYNYIRKNLNDVKKKFSSEIYNNHGISLKYLRQLLLPIGIDIPEDANLRNSLELLANERGSYAHKFRDKEVFKKSIEPEKAKTIINDCLLLFCQIKDKAKISINDQTPSS